MSDAGRVQSLSGPALTSVGGEPRPMLHHTQTILASEENESFQIYGDCLRAVVAGLFGLHMDAVPNLVLFDSYEAALRLFSRGWGLDPHWVAADPIPDEPCVLLGKSPRGRGHAVTGWGGEVRWDPHPSRAGLTTIDRAIVFVKWEDGAPCWTCGRPS